MASYGLLSAMKRIGRVQEGIRRAFLMRSRHSLSTRELLAWSHPRLARAPLRARRNACRAVRRAADKLAIRVGRRLADGLLWGAAGTRHSDHGHSAHTTRCHELGHA